MMKNAIFFYGPFLQNGDDMISNSTVSETGESNPKQVSRPGWDSNLRSMTVRTNVLAPCCRRQQDESTLTERERYGHFFKGLD